MFPHNIDSQLQTAPLILTYSSKQITFRSWEVYFFSQTDFISQILLYHKHHIAHSHLDFV